MYIYSSYDQEPGSKIVICEAYINDVTIKVMTAVSTTVPLYTYSGCGL